MLLIEYVFSDADALQMRVSNWYRNMKNMVKQTVHTTIDSIFLKFQSASRIMDTGSTVVNPAVATTSPTSSSGCIDEDMLKTILIKLIKHEKRIAQLEEEIRLIKRQL